jgi:hypothetical protein
MFNREDVSEVYLFLKNNPFSIFPYNFIKKYNYKDIIVYTMHEAGMLYVIHENKPLFFKHDLNEEKIKKYYNGLLIEQDIDSPHRYEYGDFMVANGDIVVDIGVAEGNFALSVVERAKQLYLFEGDENWLPALSKTFEPWKEKIIIINKFVSDTNSENTVRLDTYFEGKKIDFIKIDVEGSESQVLKGAEKLLCGSKRIKTAVCTYHKQQDANEIEQMLNGMGFTTEFSKGYMLYKYDTLLGPPYLRKGIIRGVKE